MAFLEIKNLQKFWNKGTPAEVKALKDFSISMERGEFLIIVGSNAAGKSTLFHSISGSITPDQGKVQVDGRDILKDEEFERAKYIAKVTQNPLKNLVPGLTVSENLSIAKLRGQRKGLKIGVKKEWEEEFKNLLRPLGLGIESRLNDDISLFSGGQQQAIALLAATLVKPAILLLDEHTAALDPRMSAKILKITDELIKDHNITALMVTHNITHALTFGERLIVMEDGQIKFEIKGEDKRKITIAEIVEKIEGKEILEEVI